ncbi:hypothetical protein C9374_010928 [Naegleria lovaniensis]|uniref:DUF4042 domain-containing protein n=1 Tax=Naegleria lovaniensis TaxID=51637 RepID=A0AA88KDR1_NAELO|nr:uncharacterized protein C9374_010928 [Naegleria lovaniensis]KAG2374358.1 hypothetical protein C9374_010928 [Naegleria lovaniensis]
MSSNASKKTFEYNHSNKSSTGYNKTKKHHRTTLGRNGSSNQLPNSILNDSQGNLRPKEWTEAHNFLTTTSTSVVNKSVGEVLDELNNVSYPVKNLDIEFCASVILSISEYLTQNPQDLLISKLCQLISTLSVKHEIQFSKETGGKLLMNLISFVSSSSSWLLADCLRTLSFILYDMASKYSQEVHNSVLAVVIPQSKVSISDMEVRRQAINCLVNIFSKASPEFLSPYCKTVYLSMFQNFEILARNISVDSGLQKILFSVMKTLTSVIQIGERVHVQDVEKIVTHLTRLMFFGTNFFPASQTSNSSKKDSNGFASDSDYSDSDLPLVNRESIKIRLQSLQLFTVLAKKDFKSLFSQWKAFIPERDSLNPNPKFKQTLSTTILFDPSSKVRSTAVQALASILENSELYLAQASDVRTKSSAFTSFSQSLALMIKELHHTLIYSIQHETLPVLPLSIRTLSLLIENTPYLKMDCESLLQKIAEMLVANVTSGHVDKTVQNQSFMCLGSLFGTKEPLNEVGTILSDAKLNIIVKLINYLSDEYVYIIRTESAQVLANIAKNYPDFLWNYWDIILQKIRLGLNHHDQTLRLTLIQIINNFTSPFNESKIPAVSIKKPVGGFNTHQLTETIWEKITDTVLEFAIADNNQTIRSAAVSIFSNIIPETFETFGDGLSGRIISLVFSTMKDESPNVRQSACRTVGVFVLFNRLQNDYNFLKRALEDFKTLLLDPSLNVRVRASWSLANLCDSLRLSENIKDNNTDLVLPILISCLNSCNDNDKVLCNAVRALGNISNFAKREILEHDIFKLDSNKYSLEPNLRATQSMTIENFLLEKFIQTLNSKETSVKARWNTCYALGSLLGNANIASTSTIDTAVNVLCDLLSTDDNFKVRIQAVLALSLTKHYGTELNNFKVWKSLLEALQVLSSDNPTAQYSEYKYIKTLKKQLISTLVHFTNHVNLDSFIRSSVQVQEYMIEKGGEIIASAFSDCEWEDCYHEAIKKLQVSILDPLELEEESSMLAGVLKRHTYQF